jgi:hypothetical protein
MLLNLIELKGHFAMGFLNNEARSGSSMVGWLDSVQMSEHDREIAKAYLRKTEAVIDLIWLAGSRIRAAFARGLVDRASVGARSSGQASTVAHRARAVAAG